MENGLSDSGDITRSVAADARDFVESVMSSQRIERVVTPPPAPSGRKRNASEPLDTTAKKSRTRRSLYGRPTPPSSSVVVAAADVHVNGNPSVEQLIAKLSADMHMLFGSLTERMDKLESGLEQRIATKVSQLLDKRVNSELGRVRKDVDTRLDSFKDNLRTEVAAELDDMSTKLDKKLDTIATQNRASNTANTSDITLNVVIRDLPETQNENTKSKVNAMIRDGLRLSDVTCSTAVRKRSPNDGKPGLIIASFRSNR